MALGMLTAASEVCVHFFFRCLRLTRTRIADSVASETRRIYRRSPLPNQTNLRASPGTPVSSEDQFHPERSGTDRPSNERMCGVHIEVLGDQELRYVTCTFDICDNLISFIGVRLGKNVFSPTATTVANYNSKLDQLMQELRDRAVLNIQGGVQQIREDLASLNIPESVQRVRDDRTLDTLSYAGSVGLNQAKKCFDGTRTEILKEIIHWINNTDPVTPRILWLHGQAGKGKSAIAHTTAMQAKNLGNLWSCFCFTRVRQHEGLHKKLVTTIARDLADRDPRFRLLLAGIISNNYALTDTEDIAEQWQKLIVEPLSQLASSSARNVIIVIDALDESGVDDTRDGILEILTTHGANLPATTRILLTSRPLADIGEALRTKQHILAKSLDDVDYDATTRDITLYISTKLKKLDGTFCDENIRQLAAKSGGVFEWARLACDFIRPRMGVIPKERFCRVVSHTGDGSNLLDGMYTTFLGELVQGSSELLRFRSVMRQILWSKEPLSIKALDSMREEFPLETECYPVRIVLNFMASFLSGTTDTSTPIRPFHASFYDFLLDKNRSGEFFIDEAEVHNDLALASLRVMQAGLRFNMCALPTSYMRNSDVVDLAKKVEENIPMHLLYSCRYWAAHLQNAKVDAELGQHVKEFVSGEQILFWMEALGVSKFISEAYRVLVSAEQWFQVRSFL